MIRFCDIFHGLSHDNKMATLHVGYTRLTLVDSEALSVIKLQQRQS